MSRRLDRIGLVAMLALTWAGGATAQSGAVSLDRTQARERALARSTELARRTAAREESRRLERVPYVHNPQIAIEAEGASAPWSNTDYTRRVRLEQEIDLRGERGARSRVGQASSALAAWEHDERAQAITAEIDAVYSRHLIAQRKVGLLGPLRDRARNLRSKAEAARRRETVTGFDARLLKSEALALEADWLASRAELDVADAALREWLGLAPGASLDLADDLDVRRWRCDTDSALAAALGNRRTLARAAAAESLAMQRVALEQRLNRVNPALGVSAGRERMEIERQGLSPLVDEDTMVGLELRVPLPLFATNSAALGEARLELERARAEREASIRDVREEVVTACTQLERAEELRALRRDAAESADQDLRLIESAYEGGRIPLDEYLTLRERLVRQELGLLDAVADVEASRARLIRATGIARAEWMRRAEEQP